MTAFEEAAVKAWHARRTHGYDSAEYTDALAEMERAKAAQRPYQRRFCANCGRPLKGHGTECPAEGS